MTNDLRENCPRCLQHYQKMGRVVAPTSPPERDGDAAQDGGGGDAKAVADPALESGQPQQPSDLVTASATEDTLEAAGASQVVDSQETLALAEESQAGV